LLCGLWKIFLSFARFFVKKDKYFFLGHSRLAEEREKLWATQQLAADFFGVTRVTWGQCERGNATPSGEVLAGLAQQGADVMYILTGQRSSPPAVTLSEDEKTMLADYREAAGPVRRAARSVLLSEAPAQPTSISMRQNSTGTGAVQVGRAGGSVHIYKGKSSGK
jgi:DNA-binding XRE family transcriptional regulator